MIEQARKLYKQAQADYPALKAQIEAQVVRWFWASGGMGLFSLEPFYFEQNHFSKAKILKKAPKNVDNKYQYGVNDKDEIIVGRYVIFEDQCYEEFFFREGNQIISYCFDHSAKKECVHVKIFTYKDGLLQHIYAAFKKHYWQETMYYEGDKLIRRESKGKDKHYWEETMYYKGDKLIRRESKGKDYDHALLYTYDMLGELNSITSGTGYVIYQKKGKKV